MRFPLLLLPILLGACAGSSVSLGMPVPLSVLLPDQEYEVNDYSSGSLTSTSSGDAVQSGIFGRVESPASVPIVSPVSFLMELSPVNSIEATPEGTLEGTQLSLGGRAYVNGRTGFHDTLPCGAYFDALLNIYNGFEYTKSASGATVNQVGSHDNGYSLSVGPGWKYLFEQVHGPPVFFDIRAMYETTLTPIEYADPDDTTLTDDFGLSGFAVSASIGFVF